LACMQHQALLALLDHSKLSEAFIFVPSTPAAYPQISSWVHCLTGFSLLHMSVYAGTADITHDPAWPWCLWGVLHAVEPTPISIHQIKFTRST
jgi:hypothetical protein